MYLYGKVTDDLFQKDVKEFKNLGEWFLLRLANFVCVYMSDGGPFVSENSVSQNMDVRASLFSISVDLCS